MSDGVVPSNCFGKSDKGRLVFQLIDESDTPGKYARLDGMVEVKNGGLEIKLAAHGNLNEVLGPAVYVVSQDGKAKVVVFSDINSEEPTFSIPLDGALEKRRKNGPDYASLKCPKCGFTLSFREYALTETVQPFFVRNGEPDWQTSSVCDSPNEPQEIRCQNCDAVVWKKG